MSFDYADMAATSTDLLTEFGQSVTRRTYTTGTYDPSTGTVAPATADTTRIGALFGIASDTTQIRGTLVQVGDKELYLDPDGAAAITDHYVIGGTEYTVLSYEELAPAGTAVLYILHLRRA